MTTEVVMLPTLLRPTSIKGWSILTLVQEAMMCQDGAWLAGGCEGNTWMLPSGDETIYRVVIQTQMCVVEDDRSIPTNSVLLALDLGFLVTVRVRQ